MKHIQAKDEEALLATLPLLYRLVMSSANMKLAGLTKSQVIILSSLASQGPLRMSQIAAYISSQKAQATRTVAILEEEGYIIRYNDPENQSIEYVKELKESGVIRHLWMSTHNPAMAKRAVETGLVEMLLFSINLAFDLLPPTDNIDNYFADEYQADLSGIDPVRADLYKLCERNDVGLTVMKPYAGGRLFDAKRSPFGVALTSVQCLHYCLTRPAVAAVMAGYDTPEHMEHAVAYETAGDREKDYATILARAPRHTFGQGECTYCGHCRPCPVNIDIAMVNKYYDLASMQVEAPAAIRAHYETLEHRADECMGCKGCEDRCPFGVKIAERMEKAAKLF